MKKSKLTIGALFLLVFSIFFLSCSKDNNASLKGGEAIPVPVKVVSLTRGKLVDSISSTGSLEGSEKSAISPKISGIIKEVLVKEGDIVKKGDVLARFNDEDFRIQVRQAEAALAQAKANFENAKLELKRKEELFKEKAIPQGIYDSFKARYEMAKAQLEGAKAALALAKQYLSDTVVRAPISGVVDYRGIEPGEYYMTMRGTPIFRIVAADPIKITFSLPEKYAGKAKVGQKVVIKVDAFPKESFTGRVSVVNPSVDPISRAFKVEALIPNPGYRLKPGFFASVELIFWEKDGVYVVPQVVVKEEGGKHYLFVVEDGKAVKREVVLGDRANSSVEVTSGVKEGDLVVVSGYEGLSDGRAVAIVEGQ
ncbi:MAG: efflux RND transporter periplasmic adaptor subunit [Acidobacteria bacterium]|nr:efflux RND transporter periplasmic adaptor subunit [Acidobacteriota bacterium]